MKKLTITITVLSLLSISNVFAQDRCDPIEVGMKRYQLNQKSLLFKDRAEESVYYYFKLSKPIKGRNYIMLETIGECLTDFHEYISDADFNTLRKAHERDKKNRVIRDDEG